MSFLTARPVSLKVYGKPMLRMASGIDYDVLPEGETRACHIYAAGEKITALNRGNIRDAMGLGFEILQIASSANFNLDVQNDGNLDWPKLHADLHTLGASGAEALLVVGYHWIPPSMAGDHRVVPLRCCEHDKATPIFSIWSEFTYEWWSICLAALKRQIQSRLHMIRAFALQLCGDFGEAIFPAGMMNVLAEHTADSLMHNHADFWCNDSEARRSYVRFLQHRYPDSVAHASLDPDAADLFPKHSEAMHERRRWLDFVEWYHDSMTLYAQRIVQMFREAFPEHDIVIWLGGAIEPHAHGQDNSALPKAMAPLRATVRSTASGSQFIRRELGEVPTGSLPWLFQQNYPIVKRVATACRFYGTSLWFEPPYPPGLSEPAVVARIFEAISCGASGYYEWTRTLQRQKDIYLRYQDLLCHEQPLVEIAVYFPTVSHRVDPGSVLPEPYWMAAAQLRAVSDFDVVDDRLILDGALSNYAILLIPQAKLIETDVARRICDWAAEGGTVVASELAQAHDIDGVRIESLSRLFSVGRTGPRQVLGEPVEVARRLVDRVADLLLHSSQAEHLIARRVLQLLPHPRGRVFATSMDERRVLLTNLSAQFIAHESPIGTIELSPFDIRVMNLPERIAKSICRDDKVKAM